MIETPLRKFPYVRAELSRLGVGVIHANGRLEATTGGSIDDAIDEAVVHAQRIARERLESGICEPILLEIDIRGHATERYAITAAGTQWPVTVADDGSYRTELPASELELRSGQEIDARQAAIDAEIAELEAQRRTRDEYDERPLRPALGILTTQAGTTYILNRPAVAGRQPHTERPHTVVWSLDGAEDACVADNHVELWIDPVFGVAIRDLGSEGGTGVVHMNNEIWQLIPHQPQPLFSGDVVFLGEFRIDVQ